MLVAIDDLIARLPFVMNDDDTREAEGALADLSFDAQALGSPHWQDADTTPLAVQNIIVRAAARHMKNYEGYTQSRAGDEAVQWAEQDTPGQATFSDSEKTALKQLGGRGPFIGSVQMIAYPAANRQHRHVGYVPVDYGGQPFPLYADPVEPW